MTVSPGAGISYQIHEGSRLRLGSRPALDLKSGVEWTRKRSILLMATEGVQYVSQEYVSANE
jgi:hypothetical protein